MACFAQTVVFVLWHRPQRRGGEKEPEAPPAVGARVREEPGKTLKRREEQALDSTGEQCTVEQPILAPAPATPAWEGPPSCQGMKCSCDGAHASVWE